MLDQLSGYRLTTEGSCHISLIGAPPFQSDNHAWSATACKTNGSLIFLNRYLNPPHLNSLLGAYHLCTLFNNCLLPSGTLGSLCEALIYHLAFEIGKVTPKANNFPNPKQRHTLKFKVETQLSLLYPPSVSMIVRERKPYLPTWQRKFKMPRPLLMSAAVAIILKCYSITLKRRLRSSTSSSRYAISYVM